MNETWLDPSLPPEARAKALLSRMNLDEKIGQMLQLPGGDGSGKPIDIERLFHIYMPGSVLHVNGESADRAIRASLGSRLGIPVLLADDGIHGHSFWPGATIFPTQLALACSWDPGLMRDCARVTAREMRATGLRWTFSPVLCLARDLRWGRIDETFGEDTFLVGEFAEAMISGYQGKGLDDPGSVLATAKHYAGYSETQGGRDASEADLSRRKLLSYFLPPFERAAKAGCMTFMTGYQSIEGVPSTMNRWLLTETLKENWGFEGILVTDWNNVGRLVTEQRVCADYVEAAVRAVRAGNDLIMTTPEFFDAAREAVETGLLAESEIDAVVLRILLLKLRMGLFEDPGLADPAASNRPDTRTPVDQNGPAAEVTSVIACEEHRAVNLRAARESLVLLRNEGFLPVEAAGLRRVAVIGPFADDPVAQLGDWSLGSGQMLRGATHPRASVTTVLDGLRAALPPDCAVDYLPGCPPECEDRSGIPAAVSLAKKADLVVLVLGDSISRIGETKSTATLELPGSQGALADAILAAGGIGTAGDGAAGREVAGAAVNAAASHAPGPRVVTVLVHGKPAVLPESVHRCPALFECFNPGMEGGRAVAEAILGLLNPCGKLTISVPWHVGQQPVFYSQVRGQHGDRYADMTQESAYAFGFGLSYTTFALGEPRLEKTLLGPEDELVLHVPVSNTGSRRGVEVVQLYIEDVVTSVTWPERELKAYARIELGPGEKKDAELHVRVADLSLVDAECRRIVEPGKFIAWVGTSSRKRDCAGVEFVVTARA
jgi:beta-glucosidase